MEDVQLATNINEGIVDLAQWRKRLRDRRMDYHEAQPYPHIYLDNFIHPVAARRALNDFPKVGDESWIHYIHVNEKKHGLNKLNEIPKSLRDIIATFQEDDFVQFVSEITGIPNLVADPELEGGGLHQSPRGGFLNIHADFTVHPHKRKWRRRVNLLLYLNEDWPDSYKGHLELWSKDMKRCEQKIAPIFNRCVLFNTDEDSFHGLPEPIECPPERTRKSIALYYFTIEKKAPKKRATNYRARPGDGIKALFIYADKQLISLYNSLKGFIGLDDEFASRILRFFSRNKKP